MAQITLNSSGVASSGALLLQSNGTTTAVTVDASQNVGIGVTPSALASGYKGFEINNVGNALTSTQNVVNLSTNAIRGTTFTYGVTSPASLYQQSSGTHVWYNAASGTAGNTISFTQAMTLDASGNLLLNTTGSPAASAKMKIATSARTGAFFDLTATGGENWIIDSTNTSGSTDVLGIYASGATGMYLTDTGNLLVGTTTSTGRVAVQVAANGDPGVYFRNASGTNVGQIQVQSASTVYVTSSDYRLKENVTPMTGALAAVAALKPCTYTWKESGEASQGFIAHELAEVCPDAVIGEKDGEEMQGVDYGKLTPILTAALQEAIAKIETLEARIAVLEAK